MVDQPGAIPMWIPDNLMFTSTDATWLCIHKTAGFQTAQEVAAYFQSGSNGEGVSSHYVVGLDGTIVQCVPESRGSGANCCTVGSYASYLPYCDGRSNNMNWHSISIEHVDPATDNSTPMPAAQKAASFQLVHDICVRHNIPMRGGDASGGVIGHFNIDPINRARCPGNYAWDELWAYLNGNSQGDDMSIDINSPGVSNYFKETDPSHWQCTNGKVVAFALLGFYKRNNGLSLLGLPLSGEMYPKQGVAVQQFERGFVAYDPQKQIDNPPGSGDCYMMHLDKGPAFDVMFTAATAPLLDQIKQLQAAVKVDPAQYQALQNQLATKNTALAQIATEAAAASK